MDLLSLFCQFFWTVYVVSCDHTFFFYLIFHLYRTNAGFDWLPLPSKQNKEIRCSMWHCLWLMDAFPGRYYSDGHRIRVALEADSKIYIWKKHLNTEQWWSKVLIPKPRSFPSTCNASCAMNTWILLLWWIWREIIRKDHAEVLLPIIAKIKMSKRGKTQRERETERQSPCWKWWRVGFLKFFLCQCVSIEINTIPIVCLVLYPFWVCWDFLDLKTFAYYLSKRLPCN